MARYAGCLEQARALVGARLTAPLPEPEPGIRRAQAGAVMTADALLDPVQREWLELLRG